MKSILAIAQSGGPTTVINASLAAIIMEAQKHSRFSDIYGLVHGIEGGLKEQFLDLTATSNLQSLSQTPAAALGSSRYKVREEDYLRLIEIFRAHEIRYFAQIGGNGSMFVSHRLSQIAQDMHYELHVLGVPKTMDNDIVGTDHCPGYGSAARFMALATRDLGRDLEAMETYEDVVILEAAGRDAGWVPAACALLKEDEDEAPHLIYIPEIAFDESEFLSDIQRVHSRLGRVFVVVGEGIHKADGELIAQSGMRADSLGRNVYALSAGAGMALARLIQQHLELQVRVIRPGLITRSLTACVSNYDRESARLVGTETVKQFLQGLSDCMISLERSPLRTQNVPLAEISGKVRHFPQSYMNDSKMVNAAFYDYALPLIGTIVPIARLASRQVPRRLL
jgi:ATP-dependent phosphofructokinase / diphosphate-dependent phosphofructokinase